MKHRALAAFAGIALFVLASTATAQLPPAPAHVVVVFMENKGYPDIIGSPNAKYINSLLPLGASLTQFYAFHHPSQPNYFEFFAGSQLGVCTDVCPTTLFNNSNLASVALANGVTFGGYAENLPPVSKIRTECKSGEKPPLYVRRHCPWTYFRNVPLKYSQDFQTFPTTPQGYAQLPQISFVTPNTTDDMHSGPSTVAEIQAGDAWLSKALGGYIEWAAVPANNSLFILTWDEDNSTDPNSADSAVSCCPGISTQWPYNQIATILVGGNVKPGSTSSKTYDHHDLLRTILDLYHLPPFAGAASGCANDITGIWTVRGPGR